MVTEEMRRHAEWAVLQGCGCGYAGDFSLDEDWALVCRVTWGYVAAVDEDHWRRVATQIDMWVAGMQAGEAIEEARRVARQVFKAKANRARNARIRAQATTPPPSQSVNCRSEQGST
jgi:hypothetical protein